MFTEDGLLLLFEDIEELEAIEELDTVEELTVLLVFAFIEIELEKESVISLVEIDSFEILNAEIEGEIATTVELAWWIEEALWDNTGVEEGVEGGVEVAFIRKEEETRLE